jgi:vinculin
LVDKVVEDFLDVATPLKQLTDCVVQPPPVGLDRDRIFEDKSENLSNFSDRSVRTAKMVAVGTSTGNKKIAEALLATAGQVIIPSLM